MIRLREDYLAIQVDEKKRRGSYQTEGGIIVQDAEDRTPSITGIIAFRGPGKSLDQEGLVYKGMDLQVGDRVTFEPGCGVMRIINGVKLLMIKAQFVTFVHESDNLEVLMKEKL